MKILILASNPRKDLNLDREIRDLKEVIQKSHNYRQFDVEDALAVRVGELQDLLFKYEPQIVHFCGHGGGEPGLVFEGNNGGEQWVRTDALRDLFRLFSDRVGCVLLNACYSEEQANEIVRHIDYVIGMNQEIRDDAAIAFSKGFYRALGYGCGIEEAYEFGCNAIQLEISGSSVVRSVAADPSRKVSIVDTVTSTAIPEHLKPMLKRKQSILNAGQWRDAGKSLLSQTQRDELQWKLIQEVVEGQNPNQFAAANVQSNVQNLPQNRRSLASPHAGDRRFKQVLIASVIGCLLGVGSFLGYHQWQEYNQLQQEQAAQSTLQQALDFASRNQWEQAIAKLNEINPESNLAQQVPRYQNEWSGLMLKHSNELYTEGQVEVAINLAKAVPANTIAFQDAQTVIGAWTKEKQIFDDILNGLKVWDIEGGKRKLQELRSPGLQQQAKAEIEKVEQRIAGNQPSESPAQESTLPETQPHLPSSSDQSTLALTQGQVEPVFRAFIAAWNHKDYTKQLNLIATDDFRSVCYDETGNVYVDDDYAKYSDWKRKVAEKDEEIKVDVSNEQFIPLPDGGMRVRYSQYYRRSSFESWGTNELYFRSKDGKVEIYKEVFYRDRKAP